MSSTSLNPWLLRLIPLVFLALWSAGFAVYKVGLAYAPPFTLLAMRYALAFRAPGGNGRIWPWWAF